MSWRQPLPPSFLLNTSTWKPGTFVHERGPFPLFHNKMPIFSMGSLAKVYSEIKRIGDTELRF